MPKIPYTYKKMTESTLRIVAHAIKIIEGYQEQGLTLTLRQLYYQFVSRDLIPNTEKSYKRIGSILNDARMCGLIDWSAIEDRTRSLQSRSSFKDPQHIMRAAADSYHLDRWANQECRVEVWCEKQALIGVFARVANRWDCPYFACKGYPSQTAKWEASQRMINYQKAGQAPIILYFGDHDPSGIDITRDIRDSMATFGASVYVERLALNMDQVDEYQPPPNPAKMSDARARGYVERFGKLSWELDALDPPVLMKLVEDAVKKYRDIDKWAKVVEREKQHLAMLHTVRNMWPQVYSYLCREHSEAIYKAEEKIETDSQYKFYERELEKSEHDGEGIAQAAWSERLRGEFCSGCGKLIDDVDERDMGMCWDCWDKERK